MCISWKTSESDHSEIKKCMNKETIYNSYLMKVGNYTSVFFGKTFLRKKNIILFYL